jgi:Lysozyme inhibitor LprI
MSHLSIVRVILVVAVCSAEVVRADDDTTPKRIVTAPSGKFYIVRYTEIFEPGPRERQRLAIVPANDPDTRIPLFGDNAEPNTTVDLAFISPDENWIYSSDSVCNARLYHRTGEFQYEPTCLVDRAWQFLAEQEKIDEKLIGMRAKNDVDRRVIDFADWSSDSRRLLLALSASIGSEEKGGGGIFKSGIGWWLCYFNTDTGKFELTDRLRAANRDARKQWDGYGAPSVAGPMTPLSAEPVGHEGPWTPATRRFAIADKRLNEIYAALLKKLEPAAREQLKQEQREWLIQRDTDAAIHANQRGSPFGKAALMEGKALSTEARVADLERQLKS